MDYRFTNEFAPTKIDEIVAYLAGPRLWMPKSDYPDFSDWTEKVHAELKSNTKRALVALSYNDVIGVAIYQRHKEEYDTLEIKNLTVRPDARGRYVASFLLRNTEIEGSRDFRSHKVVCDAKAKNLPIMYFLRRHRYAIADRTNLYHLNAGDDLVYTKTIAHLT